MSVIGSCGALMFCAYKVGIESMGSLKVCLQVAMLTLAFRSDLFVGALVSSEQK